MSHDQKNGGEGNSSGRQSDFSVSVFQCFSFFFCHAPSRLHPILLQNQSLIPLTFSFPPGVRWIEIGINYLPLRCQLNARSAASLKSVLDRM